MSDKEPERVKFDIKFPKGVFMAEEFDYNPEWDEDQRRGYRAYVRGKRKGLTEKQALSLAFEYSQPDKNEEYE